MIWEKDVNISRKSMVSQSRNRDTSRDRSPTFWCTTNRQPKVWRRSRTFSSASMDSARSLSGHWFLSTLKSSACQMRLLTPSLSTWREQRALMRWLQWSLFSKFPSFWTLMSQSNRKRSKSYLWFTTRLRQLRSPTFSLISLTCTVARQWKFRDSWLSSASIASQSSKSSTS